MTQQSRDIRTRVGWSYDKASETAVTSGNSKVAASFQDVKSAVAGMSADVLALNPALAQLSAETKTLAQTQVLGAQSAASAQGAVNYQLQEQLVLQRQLTVEERLRAASLTADGGRGGGVGNSISRFSRGLFNLPDVQITPGVSTTTISRLGLVAGGGIEAAGLGVAALGAAAAIAAPLIVGLVSVTNAYGKSAEIAANRAEVSAQAISQALEAGSTAQVRALIKQKETEIKIAQATQEILRGKAEEAQTGLANFLDVSSHDIAARLNQAAQDIGLGGGGTATFDNAPVIESQEAYNAQIAEQQKKIDEANIALEVFNLILGETGLLADQASDEVREVLRTDLDQEAEFRVHAAQLRRDGNAEQIRDEIQANQDRLAIINNYLIPEAQRLGLSYRDLSSEASRLVYFNGILSKSILPIVEAREREAEAAKKFQDAFDEAWDNLGDAQERAGKAAEKVREAEEDLADARAEHEDRLREIYEDAADKTRKIVEKNAKDTEEAARKHNERLAEIELQYARDAEAAVGNRDALALYKAQQKRQDDLDKEAKNYDEQQKKQQEAFAEQLKQQEEAQRKAIESENKIYEKRQRQLQKALDDALREEWNAQQLALAYQKQANQLQEAEQERLYGSLLDKQETGNADIEDAAVTHQLSLYDIVNTGAASVETRFAMMMANLIALAGGGSGGSSGGGGGGGGGFLPGLAGGFAAQVNSQVDQRVTYLVNKARNGR